MYNDRFCGTNAANDERIDDVTSENALETKIVAAGAWATRVR